MKTQLEEYKAEAALKTIQACFPLFLCKHFMRSRAASFNLISGVCWLSSGPGWEGYSKVLQARPACCVEREEWAERRARCPQRWTCRGKKVAAVLSNSYLIAHRGVEELPGKYCYMIVIRAGNSENMKLMTWATGGEVIRQWEKCKTSIQERLGYEDSHQCSFSSSLQSWHSNRIFETWCKVTTF